LDLAECLPSFNGGFIQNLQEIRRHFRKESDDDAVNSRLPKGTRLELPHLVLLQVYPIEDVDILTAAMEKTFSRNPFERSFDTLESIKKSEPQLWGGARMFLGHLSHDHSSFFYPSGHRFVKRLPRHTRHIAIELYKILPSTFVLAYTASLTEEVGTELTKLHATKYIGDAEFRYWLPFGRKAYSLIYGSADHKRSDAIESYLNSVVHDLEKVITTHFPSPRIAKKKHLPHLLDLRLIGFESEQDAPATERFHGWADSLRLNTLDFEGYRRDNVFFSFGESWDGVSGSCSLLTKSDHPLSVEEDRNISSIVTSLAPQLAIRHFLHEASQEIGRLRIKAYRRVTRSGRLIRFHSDLNLYARLQVQRFLVERLRVEREAEPFALRHLGTDLTSFKHLRVSGSNLLDAFEGNLLFAEKNILRHADLATDLFRSYIEIRNLEVSNRLSRRVLLWTIIVTLATISASLATFDQSEIQFGKIKSAIIQRHPSLFRSRTK
jgi:hypothetical protein